MTLIRPAHALAPHVVGRDVVAAGHGAARVAVVALDGGDEHHPAGGRTGRGVDHVGEHGREHVVVGEVAAAVVGVVGHEHVALPELLDPEEVEGEAHRQRGREHELRDPHRQCGERPWASRMVALRSLDWLRWQAADT
jgi:hypothetical protein